MTSVFKSADLLVAFDVGEALFGDGLRFFGEVMVRSVVELNGSSGTLATNKEAAKSCLFAVGELLGFAGEGDALNWASLAGDFPEGDL